MKQAPAAAVDKKVIGKSLNDEIMEKKSGRVSSSTVFVGNILSIKQQQKSVGNVGICQAFLTFGFCSV